MSAGLESTVRLLRALGLDDPSKERAAAVKAEAEEPVIAEGAARIYRRSLQLRDEVLYFMGADAGEKRVFAASASRTPSRLTGPVSRVGSLAVQTAELSAENAAALQRLFPFTAPVSLRHRRTTIGCGDRLGLATPGHVRALRNLEISPVLAQQSVRELTLTGRSFEGVVADVSFLVFQEGYEDGYGADGDHLKTFHDIDAALDAGMPMITLDLSDVMQAPPGDWSPPRVDEAFQSLAEDFKGLVAERYENRRFELPGCRVEMSATEARRCALMYGRALEFAADVDRRLHQRRGDRYDLEISIDETTAATLPSHHLFIASELERRGVAVASLAPRFIGEFQKGIDYIGDPAELERQLQVHADIARSRGGYKLSIHSGSDKFSAFPAMGRTTGLRLHLKTSGTSWLQALRVVCRVNPALFRQVLLRAVEAFPEASRLYHVAADPARIPSARGMPDSELESLLDQADCRQVLHIAYGALLRDPGMHAALYASLRAHEDLHYAVVGEHLRRHVERLGVSSRRHEA